MLELQPAMVDRDQHRIRMGAMQRGSWVERLLQNLIVRRSNDGDSDAVACAGRGQRIRNQIGRRIRGDGQPEFGERAGIGAEEQVAGNRSAQRGRLAGLQIVAGQALDL